MVVADEAGQRAMEVADKSSTSGIIKMPEAISNPLEAGGVMMVPEADKGRPQPNADTVARKATGRMNAGKIESIQTKLDQVEETQIAVKGHTLHGRLQTS